MGRMKNSLVSCLLSLVFLAGMGCFPVMAQEVERNSVSITFSQPTAEDGISFVGDVKHFAYGVQTSMAMSKKGEKGCLNVGGAGQGLDAYVDFRVDDGFMLDTDEDVYFIMEYYDSKGLSFGVEYDSVSNKFEPSTLAESKGSNRWQTAVFHLPHAKFANSQTLGADFRVLIKRSTQTNVFRIGAITITKTLTGAPDWRPFVSFAGTEQNTGMTVAVETVPTQGKQSVLLKAGQSIGVNIDDRWGSPEAVELTLDTPANGASYRVDYCGTDGAQRSATVAAPTGGGWTELPCKLEGVALGNGLYGKDVSVTCTAGAGVLSGLSARVVSNETKPIVPSLYAAEDIVQEELTASGAFTASGGKVSLSGSGSFTLSREFLSGPKDVYLTFEGLSTKGTLQVTYTSGGKELTTDKADLADKTVDHSLFVLKSVDPETAIKLVSSADTLTFRSVEATAKYPFGEDNYYALDKDLRAGGGNGMQTKQGVRNWHWLEYNTATGYQEMKYNGGNNRWEGGTNGFPLFTMTAAAPQAHPYGNAESVAQWSAPESGTAVLSVRAKVLSSASDGVISKILVGTKSVYEKKIPPVTDMDADTVRVHVAKGENIDFRLNCNGNPGSDTTEYFPEIYFMPEPAVETTAAFENDNCYISFDEDQSASGVSLVADKRDTGYINGKSKKGRSNVLIVTDNEVDQYSRASFLLDAETKAKNFTANAAYVAVSYFDDGATNFWLEYNAADGRKKTQPADSRGVMMWRTAYFKLDPLAPGTFASDFDIVAKQVAGLYLSRIELSKKPYADQQVCVGSGITVTETADGMSYDVDGRFIGGAVEQTYVEVSFVDDGAPFTAVWHDRDGNEKTKDIRGNGSGASRRVTFATGAASFDGRVSGGDIAVRGADGRKPPVTNIGVSRARYDDYNAQWEPGLAGEIAGLTMKGADTAAHEGMQSLALTDEGAEASFYVDDSYLYNLPDERAVDPTNGGSMYYAKVTYFDSADIKLDIIYDGYELHSSKYVDGEDASHRRAWELTGQGTNTYKTVSIALPYAKFANSQRESSDFKIRKTGGADSLYVAAVTVSKGLETKQLQDYATMDCKVEASGWMENAEGEERVIRALAPAYKKFGNYRMIEATSSEGPDWLTVYFPTMEPIEISGIKACAFNEFRVDYWDPDAAEWKTAVQSNHSRASQSADKIITFDPVKTTAIRYWGFDVRSNNAIDPFEVYGPAGQAEDYHNGSLTVDTKKTFSTGEDAAFDVNVTSNDEGQEDYEFRAHWLSYYSDPIAENLVKESVPAVGEKSFHVTVPRTHERYQPGPYLLRVELWKGGQLLDFYDQLWGVEGSKEPVLPKTPKKHHYRSTGTVGQFHYSSYQKVSEHVFRDLKESGYDSIQVECFWREWEPLPGVYNFEFMDEAIMMADKYDLDIDLVFHTLDRRLPDWLLDEEVQLDQFGNPVQARRADLLGMEGKVKVFSYWAPYAIGRMEQVMVQIADRYKDCGVVSGYAMSTPVCEVTFQSDGVRYYDYSRFAQDAFRTKYLQEHLGLTLDGANARWGTDYKSWDEVELAAPTLGATTPETNRRWQDTVDFNQWTVAEFQKNMLTAIHGADPSRPVQFFINSMMGDQDGSLVEMKQSYGDMGVSDTAVESMHALLDAAFYGRQVGLRVHCEPGDIPAKSSVYGNVGRAMLFTCYAGRATLNWQATYRKENIGVIYDNPAPVQGEGVYLIEDLLRPAEEALQSNLSPQQAAATYGDYSWCMETATKDEGRPESAQTVGINRNGLKAGLMMFEGNDNSHRGVDWFNMDHRSEYYMRDEILKRYKIIFDCDTKVMDRTAQDNLIKWVKDGGKLVLCGDSSMLDDTRTEEWYLLKQTSGGKAVPGEPVEAATVPASFTVSDICRVEGLTLKLKNRRDISGWDFAKTAASAADGTPMVKTWKCGAGDIVYLNGLPDVQTGLEMQSFLREMYDWAGVTAKSETTYSGTNCIGIYSVIKTLGADRYALLYPNNPNRQSLGNVKLNDYVKGKKYNVYLMGKEYDTLLQSYSETGFLANEISFNPMEFKVLKYTTDENFNSIRDFSGTQGAMNWRWQSESGGQRKDLSTFADGVWSGDGVKIGQYDMNPSADAAVVSTWRAPGSGSLVIKSEVALLEPGGEAKVTIKNGDRVIWQDTLTSEYGRLIPLADSVSAGDEIQFIVEGEPVRWTKDLNYNKSAAKTDVVTELGAGKESTWTAPADGKVTIYGEITAEGPEAICANIYRNGVREWAELTDPKFTEPARHFVELEVKQGDSISFRATDAQSGTLHWNADLYFVG